MPQPIRQLDLNPLTKAINRYFEFSVYLLVLVGFGTLASTGGLDLPAIVLAGAALALRGYLVLGAILLVVKAVQLA